MTRGEFFQILGICGMILSGLCFDSAFIAPAAILFLAFTILSVASHFLMDEGFLDKDNPDEDRIKANRDELFRQWVLREKIK